MRRILAAILMIGLWAGVAHAQARYADMPVGEWVKRDIVSTTLTPARVRLEYYPDHNSRCLVWYAKERGTFRVGFTVKDKKDARFYSFSLLTTDVAHFSEGAEYGAVAQHWLVTCPKPPHILLEQILR